MRSVLVAGLLLSTLTAAEAAPNGWGGWHGGSFHRLPSFRLTIVITAPSTTTTIVYRSAVRPGPVIRTYDPNWRPELTPLQKRYAPLADP